MFSFLLAIQLQREAGEVGADKWGFLLRGRGAGDKRYADKPALDWLKQDVWERCIDLEDAFGDTFSGLAVDLANAPLEIRLGSMVVFPGPMQSWAGGQAKTSENWGERLTSFERLMVIKTLMPSRVIEATAEYVTTSLGKEFVESPAVEMADLYKDMSTSIPLVFVLSQGSDPMSGFQRFAKDMNYMDR